MLNRRKQINEFDDQANIEHQALLNESIDFSNTINDGIQQSGSSSSVVNNSQSRLYLSTDNQTFIEPDLRSAPKFRKTRDKLYQTRNVNSIDNVQITPPLATTVSAGLINHSHGDSYELSRVSTNTNNANCTIGVGDTRYKQPSSHIYYTIQPGDTLQNLSVKYSCPVASIKRLNNIWSDQDFFGLSKIRLPVGKFRLIEDVIQEESPIYIQQQQQQQSPLVTLADEIISPPTSKVPIDVNLETTSSQPVHSPTSSYFYNDFTHQGSQLSSNEPFGDSIRTDSLFKNLDLNIERARSAAKFYDDNANAIMQNLVQNGGIVDDSDLSEASRRAQREAETLPYDLSDFGLSYNFLLLFIFIVCLVCPLAYVIYLEETHRDSHHYHHNQRQHYEQTHELTSHDHLDELVNKVHYEP